MRRRRRFISSSKGGTRRPEVRIDPTSVSVTNLIRDATILADRDPRSFLALALVLFFWSTDEKLKFLFFGTLSTPYFPDIDEESRPEFGGKRKGVAQEDVLRVCPQG